MSLSLILKTKWFPIFLPRGKTTSVKLPAWKILTINATDTAGQQLICKRLKDDKTISISFKDLERKFLPEPICIYYMEQNAYVLDNKTNNELIFKLK